MLIEISFRKKFRKGRLYKKGSRFARKSYVSDFPLSISPHGNGAAVVKASFRVSREEDVNYNYVVINYDYI